MIAIDSLTYGNLVRVIIEKDGSKKFKFRYIDKVNLEDNTVTFIFNPDEVTPIENVYGVMLTPDMFKELGFISDNKNGLLKFMHRDGTKLMSVICKHTDGTGRPVYPTVWHINYLDYNSEDFISYQPPFNTYRFLKTIKISYLHELENLLNHFNFTYTVTPDDDTNNVTLTKLANDMDYKNFYNNHK